VGHSTRTMCLQFGAVLHTPLLTGGTASTRYTSR